MTREEAIDILRNTAWFAPSLEPVDEAIDMATEALSAVQGWIPFSEKLPEKWQHIFFTEVCRVAKRKPYVGMGQFTGIEEWNFYLTNSVKEKEKNHLWGRDKVSVTGRYWHMEDSEIIAWIPMPPPYEDSHADDWILKHDKGGDGE